MAGIKVMWIGNTIILMLHQVIKKRTLDCDKIFLNIKVIVSDRLSNVQLTGLLSQFRKIYFKRFLKFMANRKIRALMSCFPDFRIIFPSTMVMTSLSHFDRI